MYTTNPVFQFIKYLGGTGTVKVRLLFVFLDFPVNFINHIHDLVFFPLRPLRVCVPCIGTLTVSLFGRTPSTEDSAQGSRLVPN